MEKWEPRTVTTREVVEPGPVATLAALFDDSIPAPGPSDELPRLWHWLALARWPTSSELGPDGHTADRSISPPAGLPRRMFAGGEVTFHGELRVGETVRQTSAMESVSEKAGRSGRLVVIALSKKLYREDGTLAIEERQDLIYGEASAPWADDVPTEDAAGAGLADCPFRRVDKWRWDFSTDPMLLMRFSGATANAHRIHYDWPYATQIEGYPALVVHGPLMTLALAEVLRLERHPGHVTRMRYRHRAPLFCGQPAQIYGRPTPGGFALDLFGSGGATAGARTSLTVEFRQVGTSQG